MQATQKIFIGFVAFCATLGAAIGVFLYASAIPYFFIIGKFVAGLLITILVCAAIYIAVRTISEAGIYLAKLLQAWRSRRLVVHNDIASYHNDDGTWMHLSVEHEKAKAIPQVAISKQEELEPLPSEAWVVLDMHWQGIGFKRIAEATKWTEYEVRKLCNRVDAAKKSKQPVVDFAQDE